MPKVALLNQTGSNVGEIELNDSVFGIEPNQHVLFEAVIMQRASLRQGTHKVKNRSEVAGGVVNLGVKRVLVVLVKDLSVRHNGAVVVSYLDQLHVHIHINYLKKFAV
jgi:hypothetical protein